MTSRTALAALFFLLLLVHVVYSVTTNTDPQALQRRRVRRLHLLTQAPLFWLALYFGAVNGVFSRQLVSPVHIAAGLVIGHAGFGLSLLITNQSWGDTGAHLLAGGALWRFAMRSPIVLSRFLGGAVAEELIYRASAQSLAIAGVTRVLGDAPWTPWVAVVAVAIVFVVVHREFFTNTWWQASEFIAFAILLGAFYYLTGSFILVCVIHAVRNVEIAYLEFVAKAAELGDEELAIREMERAHLPVRLERT